LPNHGPISLFYFQGDEVRLAFIAAIKVYHRYTCIRFIPRKTERNYIYVVSEGGCWSYIGKSGGKQKLSLGPGCEYKGTAIHEIMHALGFFHEQSRRDRDSYITIHLENIVPGVRHNFDKYPHGKADYLNAQYDYGSIMHYPEYAFSENGKKTIVPIRPGVIIGQRRGLSSIDIQQINTLYSCNSGGYECTQEPISRSVHTRHWVVSQRFSQMWLF
ncbi:hypothetical protein QZH41_009489, partial [Actinostola sp. cb2023]